MPLSLNEIRDRARAFAREWDGETSERAEAQSFWNDFFHVFGKKRRSVAVYEQKARRFAGTAMGRIDLFWPGVMLAEHKSAGVDLDAAFDQATDYFAGLTESEKPQYILVSDFQRFRLYDLDGREPALAEQRRGPGRLPPRVVGQADVPCTTRDEGMVQGVDGLPQRGTRVRCLDEPQVHVVRAQTVQRGVDLPKIVVGQ